MLKTTPEAYRLFHEGQLTLSAIEHSGIRVDKARLDKAIQDTQKKIVDMEKELQSDKIYKQWKRVFKDKTNLGSRDQLAHVVYKVLGHEVTEVTTGGKTGRMRASTRKSTLELIDLPFVQKYLELEPTKKSLATNLLGIQREMVEHDDGCWYVHPHFNLNTVTTFRSSSSQPNWQNFPKRNPTIAALVRPLFIPRKGRHFVEIDYSQIEVRVAGIVTKDRALRRYILDKSTDMHRDQAVEIFFLPKQDTAYWKGVGKPVRQTSKNKFVFAELYGSRYFQVAKPLWDDIGRYSLKAPDGTGLKDWLRKHGITELGPLDPKTDTGPHTFVRHMQKVEEKLWNTLQDYAEWKKKVWFDYRQNGWLQMLTGFTIFGQLSYNDVTNYYVQGPAFHCELWSIIEMQKEITKRKWKSKLLGEIHDSDQGDVPPREVQDYLALAKEIKTERLPKAWPWITLPLEISAEVAEQNASWHSCREWKEQSTGWFSLPVDKAAAI